MICEYCWFCKILHLGFQTCEQAIEQQWFYSGWVILIFNLFYKILFKISFLWCFLNFDDFAQKCMHSAKSSISFGTLIFYCVHQKRLTILHTLLPTKAIKWKKMYNFIQGTKRDCWFCTMHTLLCQIINLWSRVVKESVQFYGLVGKCVQNHQSLLVPLLLVCTPKEIVDSAHTFTCRAIKWNVWNSISSFTTLLQEVLILHKSVSTVQNHQSFFGTFILYCVQQKRLLILRTL